MSKPEKIYLHNPNLINYLAGDNANIGSIRETYFINQLSAIYTLHYGKTADFVVDNQYTFEVGGKNKNQKQIHGLYDAYIVKDDIETGIQNIIPLWLFGFLY
jgi:hypothetical protein